jgi:hypothetical protein
MFGLGYFVFKKSNLSGKVEGPLSDGCDIDRFVVEKGVKIDSRMVQH